MGNWLKATSIQAAGEDWDAQSYWGWSLSPASKATPEFNWRFGSLWGLFTLHRGLDVTVHVIHAARYYQILRETDSVEASDTSASLDLWLLRFFFVTHALIAALHMGRYMGNSFCVHPRVARPTDYWDSWAHACSAVLALGRIKYGLYLVGMWRIWCYLEGTENSKRQ